MASLDVCEIKKELETDCDSLSNLNASHCKRMQKCASDVGNNQQRIDGPAIHIESVFSSSNHGDSSRGRFARKRVHKKKSYHQSRSRSSSSESRSRSSSPYHKRLLTEAEFQHKTLNFQEEMLKMQRKTIKLLQELKDEIQNSHVRQTPNFGPIQESLVSIHDHEREKTLLYSQTSSRAHSVSDGQSMESFDHRDHQSPHTSLQIEQLPSVNWPNPLANIMCLSTNSVLQGPLLTMEELKKLEDTLMDDNNKMILLVQQLCRFGATDSKDMVKKGLRSLMKKSLMEMLNMEGQRSETTGKKGFKNSIVCTALTDAVLLQFPDTNHSEVLKHIQLQLRYSKRHKAWN